jgi:hypothetical protein
MSAQNKWQPRDTELINQPSPLFIEGSSHFLNYPYLYRAYPLHRGEMDQLLGFRSDGHVLHTELLRLDALTSFEAQTKQNPPSIALGGFEAQTTKPAMSTAPRARPPRSDACHASLRPRRQHGPLHHVLAQVCVPGVSHRNWSSGCSDLSVKTQHSPFTALGPSARACMTFTLAINHHSCAPHRHTTSRPI